MDLVILDQLVLGLSGGSDSILVLVPVAGDDPLVIPGSTPADKLDWRMWRGPKT